jgi:hypothetical protein
MNLFSNMVIRPELPVSLQSAPQTITELRKEAGQRIESLAGQTRLRYITDSAGQGETYAAKFADAKAYIAAGYPTDATPYVWINAEATATGTTPTQVADLIVYTANLWALVGAQIEGARQAAKIGLNSALTTETIETLEAAFKAAMAAL